MKKWIIALAVLVLAGFIIFRAQPLIPDGYLIEHYGGTVSSDGEQLFSYEPGVTLINYNSGYPNGYSREYITIDTDELEAILNSAKYRVSLSNYGNFYMGDVKYSLNITLANGDRFRHIQLNLGNKSWDEFGRIHYDIINADEIIAALDSAKSIERIYVEQK